jgi:tellurite methyltransferase
VRWLTAVVIRSIEGFHQDEDGDWVAHLSCLHNQHLRHRPPFWDRPWVLTEQGRDAQLGADLDCPLCDRAELPDGLEVVRTAGPFDATTLPAALQRDHRVAEHTWGVLRVIDGAVVFTMDTAPSTRVRLRAGDRQAIPPGVLHALLVDEPMLVEIDFLVRAAAGAPVSPSH